MAQTQQHRDSRNDEVVVDDLLDPAIVNAEDVELDAKIDELLESGDADMGDALLLDSAAHEKTQAVKGTGRSAAAMQQSHSARAWTQGGRVD